MILTIHDHSLLAGVHPDLRKVFVEAARITTIPFKVTEGLRTLAKQRENIAKGVSWTMKSRHLTGHAVDVVPMVDVNNDGTISGSEMYAWPLYYKLAPIIKQAAKNVGVSIEWGGDWRKNKDGPHWQLPWASYPNQKPVGLIGYSAGTNSSEYLDAAPVDGETEDFASGRLITTAAGGTGVGATLGWDPLASVVETLTYQQGEITSGQIIRIVIGLAIIATSIWAAWRHHKRGAYLNEQ